VTRGKATNKLVTEQAVKNALLKHFCKQRYHPDQYKEKSEHGWDLIVKYPGNSRRIRVEAKGDTKAKSQQNNKVITGLGQVVTRFVPGQTNIHGLAFPSNWRDTVFNKISHAAMQALNLRVYLVKPDGKVDEISLQNYHLVKSTL